MIVAIVARSEQRAGLLHQIPIMRHLIGRDFDRSVAIGGKVQIVGDGSIRAEIDGAVVQPRRHRRIDQRVQRRGLKFDLVAGFACNR